MILSNNPTRQTCVIIKNAPSNGNQKQREKETNKNRSKNRKQIIRLYI